MEATMADRDSRSGSTYLNPDILDFVQKVHAPHDEALARAFSSPEAHGMPAIQVAPSEGKLIGTLLKLAQAKRAVEVGTLAGYSAIWIARSLPKEGHLWTVEADPRHADVAQANIKAAGLEDRVTVVEGPALGVLGILERHGPFDAVFVDADKENYPAYGRWAADHLRPGGLLIADNAFYFGRLMEDDPGAEAVRRFHQEAASAFDTVCIATPDGLLLGVRKPR
jgi:caffeoyl-CoA O-methyltransferase